MKRKWSERLGDEFTALLDILISVSFSSATDRGRKLLETLVSFKLNLKHWPTAYWAENGRTPIDSCGLQISSRIHFNKHRKCNGIPMLLRDENSNVFIIRFIKDTCIILVRFLRGQLCICQLDISKTREGYVKQEYLLSFYMFFSLTPQLLGSCESWRIAVHFFNSVYIFINATSPHAVGKVTL